MHPERQPLEQQESSLGIAEVLEARKRAHEEERDYRSYKKQGLISNAAIAVVEPTPLTDAAFNKVPSSKEDNALKWARFYVSLYYNKLAVNLFGFMTGWSWYNRIDDLIILGALPTPTLIKELHQRKNVNTVINLCAEFPGYENIYNAMNIKQIRLETNDFTMPSLDAIHKGIDEIVSIKNKQQASPENNSTIYLHCKAGRGRSAAIAFCYLLRMYDLNLAECQKVLIEKRIQVDKDLYKKEEIKAYYKDLLSDIDLGKYTRKPL